MAVTKHPALDGMHEAFEQARRNQRFWNERWDMLLAEYPDEFVALRNGEIVAHDPNLITLDTLLTQAGIRMTKTDVRFVNTEPHY